ncbi:MAG TPA: response regulator, partial [Ktedonobacterales bacterium]
RLEGAPSGRPRPDATSAQDHGETPHDSAIIASGTDLNEIPAELKHMFVIETRDDVRDLRRSLIELEERDHQPAILHDMGRIAHKIKGAAATMEFGVIAELAHTFEDMLLALLSTAEASSERVITLLNQALNMLEGSLEPGATDGPAGAELLTEAAALRDHLRALLPDPSRRVGDASLASAPTPPMARPPEEASELVSHALEDTLPLSVLDVEAIRRPARRLDGESHLRVDVRRLDDLMARVSALATNRASLAQVRDEIGRFQAEMDHAITRLRRASAQVNEVQPLVQALAERPASGNGESDPYASAQAQLFHRISGPQASTPLGRPFERDGTFAQADLTLERYSEFDQALRALAEAVTDLISNSSGLRGTLQRFTQANEAQEALMGQMQQDITAIRLVPLQDLVPRLTFAARQIAHDQGKPISFVVRGEMTQIDRDISEALTDPLMQLLRNAIVHGIEAPEERAESGKPAQGAIWLHAYYVGNEVTIEVGDDGCGINPNLLVAAAIAAGYLDAAAGQLLSEAEALDLMFVPGISTIEEAHVAGGRGIGLDEVRTVLRRLKGFIQVRSELGRGTVFRIRVPISLSVQKVLHIAAAGGNYAVPFSSVQRTLSLNATELITASAPDAVRSASQSRARTIRRVRLLSAASTPQTPGAAPEQQITEMPAFAIAETLGYEFHPREPQPALVVRVGQQRVALLVDDVHGEHEVVIRALPKHLCRFAVRGATVTLSGQVLLLLDLPELVTGMIEGKRSLPAPRPLPRIARTPAPRIMVVDDSISMRSALELILTRAGHAVQLARDGFEALELLLQSLPRVMILDIEMPRLDGFELLRVLRSTPQFAGVRVAMLTTRASPRHRAYAEALGADAYLIKPCPDQLLLDTIRRLLEIDASSS